MFPDESEMALPEVLNQRYDTCIDGYELDEEEFERYQDRDWLSPYEIGNGCFWQIENDGVFVESVDGEPVGILVADEDAKHVGVDHPHEDLPHLIGLYVREQHRNSGIASGLIDEFMNSVESDICVVDCASSVKPFYEQLPYKVIYLEEFKR